MATNHAAGCSYTATAAHASYPDTGGVQLTDGTIGTATSTDGAWVGWQSVNPEIVIDLGSSKSFEFVSIHQLLSGTTVLGAEKIKVYGSADNVTFTYLGSSYSRSITGWWNTPAAGTYRYVKLVITRSGYTDNTANTNYVFISEIRVMSAYDVVTYPNDAYVVLDAPLQGAAGATTFADRYGGKTLTGSGGPVVEAKSKYGRNSTKLDGTDDYITSDDSTDYAFGTGDFCIEGTICHYNAAGDANAVVFETAPAGTAGGLRVVRTATTDLTLKVLKSGDSSVLLATTLPLHTEEFVHLAIGRVDGVLYMFIDGRLAGSVACTEDFTTQKFAIGGSCDGANTANLAAWMSNVRVSKGAGRYSSDFLPPKRPFGTPAYTAFSKKSKIKFTATPEDDYPIKFVVTSASFFADTISAVGEDIRFADLNGNPLSYWIESWTDGTTATIWIRIPTAGTTQIWAYWGNSDAISESAPFAVNDWYDDMNGNGTKGRYIELTVSSPTSGPSKFEYSFGRGYYVQKNNVYNNTVGWGGQLRTRGLHDITCGIEVVVSTKHVDDDPGGVIFGGQEGNKDQFYWAGFFPQQTDATESKISKDSMLGSGLVGKAGAISTSTIYAHRVLWYNGTIKWYVGGTLHLETTDETYSQGEVGLGVCGLDEGQFILPLIARKYDGTDRLASFVSKNKLAIVI